jgi:hypothetical protein
MATDVGEEELQRVACAENGSGGEIDLVDLIARRADLQPDRLELVLEQRHLVVAQVQLDLQSVELPGLDEAPLLRDVEERADVLVLE